MKAITTREFNRSGAQAASNPTKSISQSPPTCPKLHKTFLVNLERHLRPKHLRPHCNILAHLLVLNSNRSKRFKCRRRRKLSRNSRKSSSQRQSRLPETATWRTLVSSPINRRVTITHLAHNRPLIILPLLVSPCTTRSPTKHQIRCT